MHPDDLERLIDRELHAVPAPRAPRTLLPRVMAAVARRRVRPWYERGWAEWPAVWQFASLVALVALFTGIGAAWPQLADAASAYRVDVSALLPSQVLVAAGTVNQALDVVRVLWRALVQPLSPYLVAFIVTMFFACLAFGTALDRVALGGASEP
jgi:hypothetical protein